MKLLPVLLLAAGVLRAPEITGGDSVEWMAYDADLIVVGTVTEAKAAAEGEGRTWESATLAVTETLKGEKKDAVDLIHLRGPEIAGPALWKKEKKELLLFLVSSKRYEEFASRYGDAPWAIRWGSAYPLDGKPPVGLFDAKFAEHQSKDGILRAARQAITAMDRVPPKPHRVSVPFETPVHKRLYAGSTVYLTVPLDAATEKRAVDDLASADLERRTDAVRALSSFPSEKNIQRLKKLLADDGVWVIEKRKHYPVRIEAARILKDWKQEFPEPVTQEPLKD